jgi:hypothetical protein
VATGPITRKRKLDSEAGPAQGTREQTTLAQQKRRAMYRGQQVPAGSVVLATDQNERGRTVRIVDGTVFYGSIRNHRRQGIVATVTARMIAANRGTAAAVNISGEGLGVARGHLLARCLGGDGHDVRNLVPLAHSFTNLQHFQLIERNVLHHALRHQTQAQRDYLGDDITLAQSRHIVNDPHYRNLHTRGYYHIVRYDVTPRYRESDIYPTALKFMATCLTCGEWVQQVTIISNTII